MLCLNFLWKVNYHIPRLLFKFLKIYINDNNNNINYAIQCFVNKRIKSTKKKINFARKFKKIGFYNIKILYLGIIERSNVVHNNCFKIKF